MQSPETVDHQSAEPATIFSSTQLARILDIAEVEPVEVERSEAVVI
jgi:hypothetical protein